MDAQVSGVYMGLSGRKRRLESTAWYSVAESVYEGKQLRSTENGNNLRTIEMEG